MVKVKTNFNDDVRLLGDQAVASFSDLVQKVSQVYSLAAGSFSLYWIDEDGDKITIGSNADWTEALRLSENTIRLHVMKRGQLKFQPHETEPVSSSTVPSVATPSAPPPPNAPREKTPQEKTPQEQTPQEQTQPQEQTLPPHVIDLSNIFSVVMEDVKRATSGLLPEQGTEQNIGNEGSNHTQSQTPNQQCQFFQKVMEDLQQKGAEDTSNSSGPAHGGFDLNQMLNNFHEMAAAGHLPPPFVHLFGGFQPQATAQQQPPKNQENEGKSETQAYQNTPPPPPDEIQPGEHLPIAPLRPGNYGPGVEQLQFTLIQLGLMRSDAIRWRSGFYARNTTRAIASLFDESQDEKSDEGVYTERIRNLLLSMLGVVESTDDTPSASESETAEPSSSAPQYTSAAPQYESAAPQYVQAYKHSEEKQEEQFSPIEEAQQQQEEIVETEYKEQLKILKTMGFHQSDADIARSLNKHNGAVPFVVSELLSL